MYVFHEKNALHSQPRTPDDRILTSATFGKTVIVITASREFRAFEKRR